jgi:hypothetical protein
MMDFSFFYPLITSLVTMFVMWLVRWLKEKAFDIKSAGGQKQLDDLVKAMGSDRYVMLDHHDPEITIVKKEEPFDPVDEVDGYFKEWKDDGTRKLS